MTDYVPQASDTVEEMDRRVFDGLRKMTPAERLAIAGRASTALARLSLSGLRHRFPSASEENLHRRAGAARLGRELTVRFYGPEGEAWLP